MGSIGLRQVAPSPARTCWQEAEEEEEEAAVIPVRTPRSNNSRRDSKLHAQKELDGVFDDASELASVQDSEGGS